MKKIKIVFLHGLAGSKNYFEYLEKEFSNYQTTSFDLIGFGNEAKPKIDYALSDFVQFLEKKLQLYQNDDTQYILIGHSLGALLAKELVKKYPQKIMKVFLMGYPFLDKRKFLANQSYFNGFYIKGTWWTKIICEMRMFFKALFLPLIFLFGYKYRKSYLDYFNHTYRSAYGTIQNTILKDDKNDLFELSDKIVFINGQKDENVDLEFCKKFKQYIIESMGHLFFNHEKQIAKIIKDEIKL